MVRLVGRFLLNRVAIKSHRRAVFEYATGHRMKTQLACVGQAVLRGPPNLEECGNQSDVPQCGSDGTTTRHANEKATGKTGWRMMEKWLPDGNMWQSTNPAVEFRLTLKGLWYGEGHLQGMLPPLVSCGART